MDHSQTYRCEGCGSTYRVLGEPQPTVVCRDCDRAATLCGTAAARRAYRLGYSKYREARRQLSDALSSVEDGEMTLARGGFNGAATEFETSVSQFTRAVRESDDPALTDLAERARKKATCLWQAAEWLSGLTFASEQGESARAKQYRRDAENRLRAAREYGSLAPPADAFQAAALEGTSTA